MCLSKSQDAVCRNVCSPNDFGRLNTRAVVYFRITFQWCEYRIWATTRWKVLRKYSPNCLFERPKSSLGEHKLQDDGCVEIARWYRYPYGGCLSTQCNMKLRNMLNLCLGGAKMISWWRVCRNHKMMTSMWEKTFALYSHAWLGRDFTKMFHFREYVSFVKWPTQSGVAIERKCFFPHGRTSWWCVCRNRWMMICWWDVCRNHKMITM